MSPKKSQKDDKFYCKSIAKSISDIIRYSLDEDFRKKSFELFGVSSTAETEREIKKRLMFLVENGETKCQKDHATAQNPLEREDKVPEKDEKNAKDESETSKEAVLTSNTNSETDSQRLFKRNWLQISSQQYREIIKRKKLKYYSQPQLRERHHSDFELFSSRAHSSDSQPSSACSSQFSERTTSSSEHSGDTTSYFKEKFRDLFKQNSHNYFKTNLKSHRFLSETSLHTEKFNF